MIGSCLHGDATDTVTSRIGITPVGSPEYRLNRLRFHLLAYCVARQAQLCGLKGRFIIRCDDTDDTKVNRAYLLPYLQLLKSLGVQADLWPFDTDVNGFPLFQSRRTELYDHYLQRLVTEGFIRSTTSGLKLFDVSEFYTRYGSRMRGFELSVMDAAMGLIAVNIKTAGRRSSGNDPPLALASFPVQRSNGAFLFNFCSPVDDGTLGTTHVVRDRHKLSVLAKQEMIRISLGFPELTFVHAPNLVGGDRRVLTHASRYGQATFENIVAAGITQTGLLSYLLSTLQGASEHYHSSIDDFVRQLRLEKIHQADVTFAPAVLENHNKISRSRMTWADYLTSAHAHCSRFGIDLNLLLILHEHLTTFLKKSKPDIRDLPALLDCLLNPAHHFGPDTDSTMIQKIFSLLESSIAPNRTGPHSLLAVTNFKDRARDLETTPQLYAESLRFVLTGTKEGTCLRDIVEFLGNSNLIAARTLLAKERLSAHLESNISPSLDDATS